MAQSANNSRLLSYLLHTAWVELLLKTFVILFTKLCSFGYTSPYRFAEPKSQALHRSISARQRTKLMVFLGTPHRGSAFADWGQIAMNIARLSLQDSNKKFLKTLEVNSEVLDNIQDAFRTIVYEGGLTVHSFQEARGISGMKRLHNKVRFFQISRLIWLDMSS